MSPADEEPSQSNSSDSDQWVKVEIWRTRKPSINWEKYVLNLGFLSITDVEYENMPDPILKLASDQLALLRRGYLRFYDFPQNKVMEIAYTIGDDKVPANKLNKTTQTAMKISLVSCTLRIHISNY